MTLPASISSRLRLPLMAAPMLRVSGPALVSAACRAGVVGSFPTVNARTAETLDAWLAEIEEDAARAEAPVAPVCPNIIMRSQPDLLAADVDVLVRRRVPMVLASVGSPAPIVERLHDVGCLVLADVASMRHAEKAIEAGADGLVLLSAGAGGQTGWANGMSFVRAVRAIWDGPLVLAGGISDGAALWAARVMGCDLGLMGTRVTSPVLRARSIISAISTSSRQPSGSARKRLMRAVNLSASATCPPMVSASTVTCFISRRRAGVETS